MNKLIEKLKLVKDYRSNKGKRHELWVILLVVILGIMAGYIAYRAIGDFAKFNQKIIKKSFHLGQRKLPSYSTIRRVMLSLDWSSLLEIFNNWAVEIKNNYQEQDWLAIDGKTLKSTVINYDNNQQNFIVFASLFSQETALVLQIKPYENKKVSEIRKFREIVGDCPFTNQVYTGDSLHCQKETTKVITESNNDYLITVKKNQKKLYEKIETISQSEQPISTFISKDKSHGRDITREISVFHHQEDKLVI